MARTYTEESAIPYVPTDTAIFYPDTDGKPMSASDLHRRLLIRTLDALEEHFAETPDVYVSGDIMMYYKEGEPGEHLAPDVLVCFGINRKERETYKTWVEGKAPDFVMEFASKTTYDKDLDEKMDIYASLNIQDYFLYDPQGLYLPSTLMGFTLVDGVYKAIPPDEHEGFRSSVLGLDFRLQDTEIRIFDPIENEWVKTKAEKEAARAEQEAIARENAETRAENAEARAEQEAIARENAEAELAQLREKLARLKASRE
ncbi:Uma2 family endonuclease [Candidatus Poribacteria bacterium]|nr:Uma2 family endonuclease [Candidatus Poribacteria bacterium]MYI92834.1 Uma2 family endonuclease [Candidatus Poribacteria bacterium]